MMSADQKPIIGDTDLPAYQTCTELGPLPAAEASKKRSGCRGSECSRDAAEKREEDVSVPLPNEHLNMDFEDIFHEHKSTFTHPSIYRFLRVTFKYTKLFVYNVLVFLFALKMIFVMAIAMALLNFVLVWVWNPMLKVLTTVVRAVAPALTVPFQALCHPIVDAFGRVFRQIRIKGNVNRAEKILHV